MKLKKNAMLEDILEEIYGSPIGGKVNIDETKYLSSNCVELHCWDGRRYLLTVEQAPDGCAYDTATGLPIKKGKKK